MFVVKNRKLFYGFTGVVVALAIGAIAVFGLPFGIDFTGGTLAEVRYENERPTSAEVHGVLAELGVGEASVRPAGELGYIVRTPGLTDEARAALEPALSLNGEYPVVIERYAEVGPTIGVELRNKSFVALALVMLAIILYLAISFRKVSKPVSAWVYGVIAVAALVHDILIPAGVFAVLGYVFGAQIDTLFVMALLAILGYSVNDTIVVLDRVRDNLAENIERRKHEEFTTVVGRGLNQTIVRSINTSLTTSLVLIALYFIGPDATQYFALTLLVGVIAGTYSSIALAAPLLVTYERWRAKRSQQ